MKYFIAIFGIFLSLALTSAQFLGPNFNSFGGFNSYGLRNLVPDFGGSSAFAGGFQQRDPRQNRGPVVFPPSPADAPVESSGVIVGASGYGFVPPQNKFINEYPQEPVPVLSGYNNFFDIFLSSSSSY